MVKNQAGQFKHSFNRTEILFVASCLLLIISGCMVPEYQNPSGYSESYHRNLNGLPLPEPVDRLSQKVLYDNYNAEIPEAQIEVTAKSKKNLSQVFALNKGFKADSSSNRNKSVNEEGIENSSKIENVNHQRYEEFKSDKSEDLTRWQKMKRLFSR